MARKVSQSPGGNHEIPLPPVPAGGDRIAWLFMLKANVKYIHFLRVFFIDRGLKKAVHNHFVDDAGNGYGMPEPFFSCFGDHFDCFDGFRVHADQELSLRLGTLNFWHCVLRLGCVDISILYHNDMYVKG